MDDQHADELRMLRERAYGPSADIHDDPVALARLRELEEASAVPTVARDTYAVRYVAPDVDAVSHAAPYADAVPPADSDSLEEPDDAPHTEPPAAGPADDTLPPEPEQFTARVRPSCRTIWLSAAALVAAMIVGAGITMAVSETHPGHVAVLAQEPDSEWPTEFFGAPPQDGSRVFEDFLGLAVVIVPDAWGSTDGPDCLFVLQADGQSRQGGRNLSGGCAAPGFDIVASFSVTSGMPEQLRERFPVGSGLKFVVDGSQVFVFAKTPVVPSTTSAA